MRKNRSHPSPLAAGFALICIAGLPMQLWSQASWQYGTNTISSAPGVNVGIGTSSPIQTLTIEGSAPVAEVRSGGYLMLRPSANNWDMRLQTVGTRLDILSGGSLSSPIATFMHGGNVGIGTTNPQYKLAVNGTLVAREVIVTNTGWADYVFKPDYRPKPLNEVAAYISEHRHLPGIPSEKEVQEKGVNVGEMQVKLLAKIEELTLHMIAEHKRNNRLEQDNRELRDRITRLERALASHGGDK